MKDKRYAIVVFDKETGREYSFEGYEQIEVSPDKGVKFDSKSGILEDNHIGRICIKAWTGCENYDDFKIFTEEDDKCQN